jgi:glutathione S-transferase
MIDSETWRLLLEHYGIAYEEEPHAFIWGSILALLRAGSVQVPALCDAGLKLVGPERAIARWDSEQPPGRALVPADPMTRAIAQADWDLFHGTLATCTAQLAYYHLLPRRDILTEPFTRGVPPGEAAVTRVIYPLQRAVFSLLLRLNAKNAADALAQIRMIFDKIDARIRDERRFLQGDRLTLGDLALAAAAAPVTLPDRNRSPIPPLVQMPPAFAAIVVEMQARPTAKLVEGVYRAISNLSGDSVLLMPKPAEAIRPGRLQITWFAWSASSASCTSPCSRRKSAYSGDRSIR